MNCKHNWINVFGGADWNARVYFGFNSDDIIYVGKKCNLCGKFKKRGKEISPWIFCFKCGTFEMVVVDGNKDKFKCNNCGNEWPPNKNK